MVGGGGVMWGERMERDKTKKKKVIVSTQLIYDTATQKSSNTSNPSICSLNLSLMLYPTLESNS